MSFRGERTFQLPPHLSGLICLCGGLGGVCLGLVVWENGCLQVHQGEMTSHLSLSGSVRACSHPSIPGGLQLALQLLLAS